MYKKIAAGLVCFTLVALGITSCQNHLFTKDSGEVGTYQLVSRQDGGTSIKMFKINTMNGDTWSLEKHIEETKNDYKVIDRWNPLAQAPMPE